MSVDLDGQVAVVTGGNGGIGLGLAEGLAGAGADIAVWGRNADKSRRAVETLREFGVRAEACDVDIGDEAAVGAARRATVDVLGDIDVCVANAGTIAGAPFWELSLDEWRRVMRVNLDGAFLTMRDCVRQIIESPCPRRRRSTGPRPARRIRRRSRRCSASCAVSPSRSPGSTFG